MMGFTSPRVFVAFFFDLGDTSGEVPPPIDETGRIETCQVASFIGSMDDDYTDLDFVMGVGDGNDSDDGSEDSDTGPTESLAEWRNR